MLYSRKENKFNFGSIRILVKVDFKMRLTLSLAKLTAKRAAELSKVSKTVAVKAIGCSHPKPEQVSTLMIDKETQRQQDVENLFGSPERENIVSVFRNAKSSIQKKKMLSRYLFWLWIIR